MTADLFAEAPPPQPPKSAKGQAKAVAAAAQEPGTQELGAALPPGLHLGTSSWSFPGWRGLVWDGEHSDAILAKRGLGAYASHPVLRTVSIDRSFYRPLSASEFAAYAAQVPDHFRFVVKAPALVCDARIRAEDGRGMQANPGFLDSGLAASQFVQPALEGLGPKTGALVFQLSPVGDAWLRRMPELLEKLGTMLRTLPALTGAPDAVIAVEVRDPQFLTPEFAAILKAAGATYCLGLHARMPPIEEQLPLLRALWPRPFVCRWSLNRRHGAYGYEEAKDLYEPFDKLVDPDPGSRDVLARVIAATLAGGFHAYVTINNKAEGSAPLSVLELAKAVLRESALAMARKEQREAQPNA